jgi:hypothetical protein
MTKRKLIAASVALIAAGGIVIPLFAAGEPASGPIARYDMRAGTTSGLGQSGQMGRMNMASMMMNGGGSKVQHELLLRLGSSRAPAAGGPKADHFMPPVARLGKSVALVTPVSERGPVDELPTQGQRPQGRILLFWGCGEHAPAGQPVVIDFSKLAAGQMPQGLWTSTILRDWGPNLQNSKTFGRWPAEDGKYVQADSSLLGAHKVVSTYAPDIAFTLSKDFMQPLALHSSANRSGSTLLSWGAIPDATGYHASLIGGRQGPRGQMGDMVMWSSSASRDFGGGLSDWISPSQVASLVTAHTVLAPSTTSCTVPVEVGRAAPDFRMGTLTAFGPEEDFSYPPRPTKAGVPWNLEWTARIRHRSTTSWMEAQGFTMGTADDQGYGDQDGQQGRPRRGLGGILGGLGGGDE